MLLNLPCEIKPNSLSYLWTRTIAGGVRRRKDKIATVCGSHCINDNTDSSLLHVQPEGHPV